MDFGGNMEGSIINMNTAIIILFVIVLIILFAILILVVKYKSLLIKLLGGTVKDIVDTNSDNNLDLISKLSEQNYNLREDVSNKINTRFNDVIKEYNSQSEKTLKELFVNITNMRELNDEKLEVIRKTNEEKLEKINNSTRDIIETLSKSLENIRTTNEQKLDLINERDNEKLEKNLNEKLSQNFSQIDMTLQNLQKSLGEISQLSSNVMDLRKTFTNTKTRGMFGEIQLESILENTMDRSQYEKQFSVSEGSSEAVDFVIKVPDKENTSGVIYIPIDAKFNVDIYNKIVEASDNCDKDALEIAQKNLKNAIESQAKSIKSKYINPPTTSEFALMFLPSEGIYSEVLRLGNLANDCLSKYRVIVVGPTNITAIINSLSVGFKYLKINEDSREIVKLLENIKKQFGTNEENIKRLKKHLSDAQKSTEDIELRNTRIVNNLSKLGPEKEKIDIIETLGIEE